MQGQAIRIEKKKKEKEKRNPDMSSCLLSYLYLDVRYNVVFLTGEVGVKKLK